MDRTLGIVLMGPRVAEQRHNPVAHVVRYDSVEAMNRLRADVIVCARDLVEIFGVQHLGKSR